MQSIIVVKSEVLMGYNDFLKKVKELELEINETTFRLFKIDDPPKPMSDEELKMTLAEFESGHID